MAISKRYRLIGIFVVLSALLLAASLPASADLRAVFPTNLTISFQAEDDVFTGKLSSRDRGCVPSRPVTVKMVAPGPDKSLATTRTNSRGAWRAGADPDPGQYYAQAPATRVKVKNTAGRRCTPGRTDFFQIFPFRFGPDANAVGVFTNGRGGCPVATAFNDEFEFSGPEEGLLMIRQLVFTTDVVSGPIRPNKKFMLRSASEAYDGRLKRNTATATYSYTTARGCTETYDVVFTLKR